MTTWSAPFRIWNRVPEPPHCLPPISVNRLFLMVMRCRFWLGRMSSLPRMLMPEPDWRTTLLVNVTSSTVDHGAPPSWLRTVNSTAKPFCDCIQLRSSRLPSMTTRRAFFSSSRFFTLHALPS